MNTIFKVSSIVFLTALAIIIIMALANVFGKPMFDASYDNTPYIDQMRGLINLLDALDTLDIAIIILSGITAIISFTIAKVNPK